MKAKLIDLLLASPLGKQVREALRFNGEGVFTEVNQLKLRKSADGQSSCEMRAVIARVEEDGLSGEAVEVDFLCLNTLAIDFSQDDQSFELNGLDAALDIETGDRFRILCEAIKV